MQIRLFVLSLASFIIALGPTAGAANSCVSNIARTLTNTPFDDETTKLLAKASKLLRRELTDVQKRTIQKVVESSTNEVYTASDVARADRLLKKARFTDTEIAALRKKGLLGKTVITLENGGPMGVTVRRLALQDFNSTVVRDLRKSKPYSYFVDQAGEIHVSPGSVNLPTNELLIVNAAERGGEGGYIIHEAGELTFDAGTKSFKFRAKYGFDTDEISDADLVRRAKEVAGAEVKHAPADVAPSRLLKCLDIVSAQANGKNFVLDRLVSDNAVTTIAIASSELSGAGRLDSAEGRQVIAADLVGGNVTGVIGSAVAKKMIVRNSGFWTSMGVRTGMGLSMIQVQRGVSKVMVNERPEESTVDDITKFNQAHFVARLPVNYAIDQFMVKSLPTMVFNMCQKYPTASLAVSPKAVRFYERYASSTIYYGLRQATIGH